MQSSVLFVGRPTLTTIPFAGSAAANLIETTTAVNLLTIHEANDVAKGAEPFKILNKQAGEMVDEYTERYLLDRKELVAQLPALRELGRLASHLPDNAELAKARQTMQVSLMVVLGSVGIGVLIGLSSGLGRALYVFVSKHLGG